MEVCTEKMLTPSGGLPTGGAWEDKDLVRFVPAEPLEAEINRLRDRLENVVIAYGMGWDMGGVIEEARKVLPGMK